MIVVLSNKKNMYKTVLPEKIAGQYWLKDEHNGKRRNLVCVEAVGGKWIAKSGKYAKFYNSENQYMRDVVLSSGIAYIMHTDEDEKTLLFADTYTDSGKKFQRMYVPVNTDITVGRDKNNVICYGNKFVSGNHAVIRRNNDVWTIQDLGSTNGTYVNNIRVGLCTLLPGDCIYIMGCRMIIGSDFISINNPNQQVLCDTEILRRMRVGADPVCEKKDADDGEEIYFYRSPRLTRQPEQLEMKVSPPISQQDPERMPAAMMIGPSLTMGMGSASTAVFSVINAVGNNAPIVSVAPTLIMSVAMMSGMILWPTITRNYEKKQRTKREAKRQQKYREYLLNVRNMIIKSSKSQSEILHENNVPLTECEDIIMMSKRNLWERSIGEEDFLSLRIGTGDIPLYAAIEYPDRGFTIEEDNLWDDLQALANEPQILRNVPILYSLLENNVSGIVGQEEEAIYDFVKGLIVRIASIYSYDEVKIMILTDEEESYQWEYAKWIPHIWDNSGNMRFFASNEDDANELYSVIDKMIENFPENAKAIEQYYIIVNASKKLTQKSATMDFLYENGAQYGFSIINISRELRNLPKECSKIIEISGERSRIYDKRDISGKCQMFKADGKLMHNAGLLTRRLSSIKLDLSSTEKDLPSMLTFLEMYKVSKIEHLNILTRWKENNPTTTLKAPVGVDSEGNLFYLDLHEKFQGPHGLVAGMTGSGKSEFIITYILSMAVNYHPDEVSFVLIDYKGGGLTGAFENKDKGIKLPHLAGTITNLDGASINRSLISIQSELRKRQTIFAKAKQISNEGTMDVYKYQKLYREGIVREPVPHLFIISDEFAELKSQQPEFMEQLISTARIGRSLGVHLILATQKPSGVVNDQIWSNSRFRVCLKVQERSDSMDMIKRPDAAELSEAGRFYLQVGYNEFFDIGQSAWCGAPYIPSEQIEQKEDDSIQIIDNIGRIIKEVRPALAGRESDKKHINQIVRIVDYLSELAGEEDISVRSLWLDEIPAYIERADIIKKYSYTPDESRLTAVIGEYDDPFNQRQELCVLPISDGGNTVIYGSAGSGKELLLNTLICGLLEDYTPERLNLFILDFGSEALQMYAKAPHVGGVILSTDDEKLNRLMKILKEQIADRKKLFADYGGSAEIYEKSTNKKVGNILVIIDNYAALSELYENVIDDISYISREGSKYRIYFLVTASAVSEIKYRVLQNFGQQYVLGMNDKSDYTAILGSVKGTYPSKIYGRGIFMSDCVYEFQTAHLCADGELQAYVTGLLDELNKRYDGISAVNIPMVPDRLLPEDIKEPVLLNRLPVAVDTDLVKTVYYDFKASVISTMTGSVFAEIEAAANGINALVDRIEGVECETIDRDTPEETIVSIFRMIVDRHNAYKADKKQNFQQKIYFVMKPQSVFSKLTEDGTDKFKVMITHCEPEYGVNFIVCDEIRSIRQYASEEWYAARNDKERFIWLGKGIEEQSVFKQNMTLRAAREIKSDCGVIVDRDCYTVAKPVKLMNMRGSEG